MKLSFLKLLQSQGFGSRKECEKLIRQGECFVNGTLSRDPSMLIETANCSFTVRGESFQFYEKVYGILNKPAGYECSHKPTHHTSVYELLPKCFVQRGVEVVGRLDADTTGLLLFSDDGAFVHHYTSPKKECTKEYLVTCKHPIDTTFLSKLTEGVLLHGEESPSIALSAEALTEHQFSLVIKEGKYHQVKRMVSAAGNRVELLHRHRVGAFSFHEYAVKEGSYTLLDSPSY